MLILSICATTVHVFAQTRDGNFWIPNNTVNSIIVDDSRGIVLLGGGFSYLGTYTGGSVMVNKTTGLYDQTFPVVNGSVDAAVPDGFGGLFIGGYFTSVGGVTRNNLAHITSAGTVTSWNPTPNNSVNALAIDNGILYVGGNFTLIDGHSVTYLAAFDAATETYDTTFQPGYISGSFSANVTSLYVYGSKLYVAGDFNMLGDSSRNKLAAVNKISGGIDSWDPSPSHWTDPIYLNINSIISYGNLLFIGGNFTSIGGQNRRSLAQVDTTTGIATSWDAQIDPYISQSIFSNDTSSFISALYVKGDTLYAGGSFQGFHGQTSYGLAALNASSSAVISGAVPPLLTHTSAEQFFLDGTTLYIGGYFSSLGGEIRKNISAINAETGGLLLWNPALSESPSIIFTSGSQVYIGGNFYSVNGVVRNGLAAIDQSTGIPTSWNPNAVSTDNETSINAMVLADTILYVGGRFTSFDSEVFYGLAAVGIAGGSVLPFIPEIKYSNIFGPSNPEIFALAKSAGKLYIGGNIDTVNGLNRNGAAAFDLNSGSLSSWNPNVTYSGSAAGVGALAVAGEKVFLGGTPFNTVGDSARENIAAVDFGSGHVLSWNPGANSHVYSFAVDGSTVYVGGSFNQIGGTTRNHIAAFDTASSTPTSWNPDLDSSPDAIAVNSSNVYIGGFFQSVGGTTRYSVAAVDKVVGTPSSWNPQIDQGNYVQAIGISHGYDKIYIGGSFNTVLGNFSQNFAAVTNPFDASLPVELTSFTAVTTVNNVQLAWATATETNNYGFEVEKKNMKDELGIMKWEKIGFVEGNGTTNSPKSYSFVDASANGNVAYRLKQIDRDGKFSYSQSVEIIVGVAPKEFALAQNYPNPFNPSTRIRYQLPVNSYVTLKVYDAIGREVATLVNEVKEAGNYSATFDASKLSSGIYFARLQSGEKVQLKKMMLIK